MKSLLLYRESLIVCTDVLETEEQILRRFCKEMGFHEDLWFRYEVFNVTDDQEIVTRLPIDAEQYYQIFDSVRSVDPGAEIYESVESTYKMLSYTNVDSGVTSIPIEYEGLEITPSTKIIYIPEDMPESSRNELRDYLDGVEGLTYIFVYSKIKLFALQKVCSI